MTIDGGDAAPSDELAAIEAEIGVLRVRAAQAHQAYVAADSALRAAFGRRDALLARLALSGAPPAATSPTPASPAGGPAAPPTTGWPWPGGPSTAPTPAPGWPPAVAPVPVQGGAPGWSPPGPVAPPRQETSTRTVQNVLFVLGGLLLGVAAIVFTAVAWTEFGMAGRAVILGAVTLLALVAPFVALARRLRGTAETFAAIGFLLLLLDGYAAWSVDLLGVQAIDGWRYAGIVAAIAALVGLAYHWPTRLAAPAFAALVVGQPVPLLLAIPARPGIAVLSLLASAMAVVDALVAGAVAPRAERPRLPRGVAIGLATVAWTAVLGWVAVAFIEAVAGSAERLDVAGAAWAGAAAVALGVALVVAATVVGSRPLRAVAAGAFVVTVVWGVGRGAMAVWPDRVSVTLGVTVLAVAVLVRVLGLALPEWLRPGPRWAIAGVAGVGLAILALLAVVAAAFSIRDAYPFWAASLSTANAGPAWLDWQVPVALAVLALAVLIAGPRWTIAPLGTAGGVLVVLALPVSAGLAWWAPATLSLGGATILVAVFLLLRRRALSALNPSTVVGAAVLLTDAVLTSAARPGLTALVLAGVAVLGLGAAVAIGDRTDPFGAAALAVGLLALPPVAGSALSVVDGAPWWALRATVAVAGLLLVPMALIRRRPIAEPAPAASPTSPAPAADRPLSTVDRYAVGAFVAGLVSAVVWPMLGLWVGQESAGVYSGLSLLLLAGALVAVPATRSGRRVVSAGVAWSAAVAALPGAGVFLASELPAVLAVSVQPYRWLGAIWTGTPTGTGLAPGTVALWPVRLVDAVALGLLAVASAVAGFGFTRRPRSALLGLTIGGPTAVLATVVALESPWPTAPFATLALGLTLILPLALAGRRSDDTPGVLAWRVIVLCGQGIVYAGAGVAGTLGVRWATLTSLGIVVVAALVVGGAGRTVGWRVAGCLVTVAAAVGEVAAAGLAAELNLRMVAFLVLGVSTLALAGGAVLGRVPGRRLEAVLTERAAHGAALVAFTLVAGRLMWGAAVCSVWGVVVALRALLPGTSRASRAAHAAVAAALELLAWWLLLVYRDVSVIEAYSLPLAGVALLAGWAALRSRPDLRSWIAYGPALLAGFLPPLAPLLATVGSPLRRLLLFVAALVVVIAGSVRRRQAPVVIGGLVLVVVAVHELVLLWQLLQGWIPLAVGGAVLLFLAITYERRLRDVTRLRDTLRRMT